MPTRLTPPPPAPFSPVIPMLREESGAGFCPPSTELEAHVGAMHPRGPLFFSLPLPYRP